MDPNQWFPNYSPYGLHFPQYNYYGSQMFDSQTSAQSPENNADSLSQIQSPQNIQEPQTQHVRQDDRDPKGEGKSAKTRETFHEDEEKFLVNLWVQYNERLESKDSRKYWSQLVEELNRNYGNKRAIEKCRRRIKYLIDKYKERKDWNKNQSGGRLWKSPFYDEIDSVLCARDVVKLPHVAEAGSSSSSRSSPASEQPSTSASSSESNESAKDIDSPSSNTKEQRRKRKKPSAKDKKQEEEEKEEKLLKTVTEQGERIATVIERMQEAQTQQMQTMNQFIMAMTEAMKKS